LGILAEPNLNYYVKKMYDSHEKRQAWIDNVMDINKDYVTVRRKKYIQDQTGIVLDYDNDLPPYRKPTEICRLLNKLGINYLGYSSYSSTVAKPKFRILIPFSYADRGKKGSYGSLYFPEANEAASFLIYMLDDKYEDIKNFRIDATCFQPWRFFYVPNNSPEAILTDDNIAHDDRPWFVSVLKEDNYIDPNKCSVLLNKTRIKGNNGNNVLTVYQITKLFNLEKKNKKGIKNE
jgi:hypothetical protein